MPGLSGLALALASLRVAWPGLAWPGLAWPGPGWPGLVLEAEVSQLEPDVATIISHGDTLTLTTHIVDVQRAHNIRVAVNDLRAQWSTLKTLTEGQKTEVDKVTSEIATVSVRANDIIGWCNDAAKRLTLANNDESQLQALEVEMVQKKKELEALNESGALLRRYQYAQIQPALTLLNMRWSEVTMQLRHYSKATLEKKGVLQESTTTTTTTTSTASVSSSALQATIAQLREGVAAMAKQLGGPVLTSPTPYHDLKAQEEELKRIRERLAELKPQVDGVEEERRALGRLGGGGVEDEAVRRAGDKLREEWAQVNRGQTEQHARWLDCSQKWINLHRTVEEFSAWMEEAEGRMRGTAAQVLVEAKVTQKEMEKQVTLKHRPSQALQTLSKEVVEGMQAEEGRKLQERVDGLMKRWKALLVDLAARRERIAEEESGGGGRKEEVEEEVEEQIKAKIKTEIKEGITTTTTTTTSTYPLSGLLGGAMEYEALVNWVEQVEALMAAPVNVTDEASLSAHSTMVQNHLKELNSKQAAMRKMKEGRLRAATTPSLPQISSLDARITKLSQTLPEYKNKVETKLGVIQTLCQEVEEVYRWTEEMRVKLALRNLSPEEVRSARVMLREKEAMFESLDTTFWVLAQDVEAKKLCASVVLKNRISTIEARLKAMQIQLKDAAPAPPAPPGRGRGQGGQGGATTPVGSTVTENVTSVIKNVIKFEETVLREGQEVPPPPGVPPTPPPRLIPRVDSCLARQKHPADTGLADAYGTDVSPANSERGRCWGDKEPHGEAE
ncbi:hypothetical protein O3P69_018911, partial [Scylla paramamosain]